jgi:hypothetical protein
MQRSTMFLALCFQALLAQGCKKAPPAPPVPRIPRATPAGASSRPVFPAQTLSTNARRDCFPEGFEPTQLRLQGSFVKFCGISNGSPRCYEIDPVANRVEEISSVGAPTTVSSEVRFEGPFQRLEIASRGWRASSRGGSLSVTGAAGNHRTTTAQGFGFHSYENTVFLPWTDGWYLVMIGWKGADVGASAVIDPFTLRMISHAALLPCGRDS